MEHCTDHAGSRLVIPASGLPLTLAGGDVSKLLMAQTFVLTTRRVRRLY
jgi:hypothetical protein